MRMHTIMFAISAALTGLTGCADEVDELFDCTQICERYSDCFDADYDVDSCVNRCEDNADADEDFAEQADACETCLDDRSCTGSFACVSECAGIVP
jgi:hypothetical protein